MAWRQHGIGTDSDYAAAAAFWEDASRTGDGLATFELGTLYLTGVGVAPDADRADQLYGRAIEQGYIQADLPRAVALAQRVKAGDDAATEKAFESLQRVASSQIDPETRGMAHEIMGQYLIEAVRPDLRDPIEAVMHFRRAVALGRPQAALLIAVSYQNGIGVPTDLRLAYAYAKASEAVAGPHKNAASKLRAELEPALSESQIASVENVSNLIQKAIWKPLPFRPGERPLSAAMTDGFQRMGTPGTPNYVTARKYFLGDGLRRDPARALMTLSWSLFHDEEPSEIMRVIELMIEESTPTNELVEISRELLHEKLAQDERNAARVLYASLLIERGPDLVRDPALGMDFLAQAAADGDAEAMLLWKSAQRGFNHRQRRGGGLSIYSQSPIGCA